MQFANMILNGAERHAFVFTKWAATVFTVFGKNKKAPADEQAVRFCVYDGRPVVWATDRTHLLMVEAHPDVKVNLPDTELYVRAPSLKLATQKARVNQSVVFPLDRAEAFAIDGKVTVQDGCEVEGNALPAIERSGPTDLGKENLEVVMQHIGDLNEVDRAGAPRWAMSSRFATTFAAVAKATAEEDVWCFNPPKHDKAPLIMRVSEELDGSLWSIVVMPLVRATPRNPLST